MGLKGMCRRVFFPGHMLRGSTRHGVIPRLFVCLRLRRKARHAAISGAGLKTRECGSVLKRDPFWWRLWESSANRSPAPTHPIHPVVNKACRAIDMEGGGPRASAIWA